MADINDSSWMCLLGESKPTANLYCNLAAWKKM